MNRFLTLTFATTRLDLVSEFNLEARSNRQGVVDHSSTLYTSSCSSSHFESPQAIIVDGDQRRANQDNQQCRYTSELVSDRVKYQSCFSLAKDISNRWSAC